MSDPQRQRRRGAQFRYKDIRILRDDGKGDRRHLPTRRNIMAHIDWLVGDARAGDSLFFHFSGALVVASLLTSSKQCVALAIGGRCATCVAEEHQLCRGDVLHTLFQYSTLPAFLH